MRTKIAPLDRSAKTPKPNDPFDPAQGFQQTPIELPPATQDEDQSCCLEVSVQEIDGYLELGMESEALEMVQQALSDSNISAEKFCGCVFAVLQNEQPEQWRMPIENAYRRLRRPVNDQVRSAMLNYYFSIGESKTAFVFFPHRSTKFFDAWTMMQVCLELGRLDEAKKVARYCRGNLDSAKDDFTKASMADALATYYLRIGECGQALDLWSKAPPEPAFHRQRLSGMVRARLMQALDAAKSGVAIANLIRKQAEAAHGPLTKHTAATASDTERNLLELKTRIEQVINAKG